MTQSVSSYRICTAALLLLVVTVLIVSGAEPLTDTTTVSPPNPSHIPPYEVNPEIRAVTPTCVSLTWELSLPVDNDVYEGNIFRIASVKMWRIGLNILSVNGETEEQDLTIAGSITNIALGPFPLEATVRATVGVSSYYKPDGNIKEVGHIRGVDTLVLPRKDRNCSRPYGRRESPCSSCICTTSLFTGPNCQEPTFHPHNVSVKPLSDSSLCIQWTLNSTDYLKPLRLANLHLVNFSLTITEARNSSVVIRDTIPINLQSDSYNYTYQVYQNITSGVEYDVVVSTLVAASPFDLVMANATAVRTFIPATLGVGAQGEDTALTLSGAALLGVIVGVALFCCLLATLVSVITTLVCVRVKRDSGQTRSHEELIVRALNPNTSLRPSQIHRPPNMQRNPAYGRVLADSPNVTSHSPTMSFFTPSGQVVAQTEQYENDDVTGDRTGTGTYDYIG